MIPFGVTLNDKCRGLSGYPARIVAVERGYMLRCLVEGIAEPLVLTPGHVVEESDIMERFVPRHLWPAMVPPQSCPLGTLGCTSTGCSPAPGRSCSGPDAPQHVDMGR